MYTYNMKFGKGTIYCNRVVRTSIRAECPYVIFFLSLGGQHNPTEYLWNDNYPYQFLCKINNKKKKRLIENPTKKENRKENPTKENNIYGKKRLNELDTGIRI